MELNYTLLVKQAKIAARDTLRAEKISKILTYISNTQKEIQYEEREIEKLKQNIELSKYELKIAQNFSHPLLEKLEKDHITIVNNISNRIKTHENRIELLTKEIESNNDEIKKWENGTNLVCINRLTELTEKFIQNRVGSEFNRGAYENAVNN